MLTAPLSSNDRLSGYTIPAFRRHITFYSKVVERGVFCAVRVVSNIQYEMKEM
jgi:hypothetical protein